jgi:hypothetical protein
MFMASGSSSSFPRKKRVVVVINKWWECDPVMAVLFNDNLRPADKLGWPIELGHPHRRNNPMTPISSSSSPTPKARAVFELDGVKIEVWCISDLLEGFPDAPIYQSSSEIKAAQLPKLFPSDAPADLVIAVGTAATPTVLTYNGCVVLGTKTFIHNAHPSGTNSNSKWDGGPFDQLISSRLSAKCFAAMTAFETSTKPAVTTRLLTARLNPSPWPHVRADYNFVALGSVNVTDYNEYATTDAQAVQAYKDKKLDLDCQGSLETTHGLIRVCSNDAPYLFISGITDRVGFFDVEVNPLSNVQNTVAAHNAGVVLAWMLPLVDAVLSLQAC